MPPPPTHFLVIHVGDNFARNGVCLSLSLLLSPVEWNSRGWNFREAFLKNSRKLVDNGN